MKNYRRLAEFSKPYIPRIFAGIILSLIVSGITAFIAWLVKPLLDTIFVEKQYNYLKILPPAIIVLYLLKGLFTFAQTYLMKSGGMKIIRDLRNKLYHTILYLPIHYFHREASGVIVSRIVNDVGILRDTVPKLLTSFSVTDDGISPS
jgi:subfamily B ATP-binding cassette protein MsbA